MGIIKSCNMYIVIECWPDGETASIVQDQNLFCNAVFETKEEAEKEAEDCQNGIVVAI